MPLNKAMAGAAGIRGGASRSGDEFYLAHATREVYGFDVDPSNGDIVVALSGDMLAKYNSAGVEQWSVTCAAEVAGPVFDSNGDIWAQQNIELWKIDGTDGSIIYSNSIGVINSMSDMFTVGTDLYVLFTKASGANVYLDKFDSTFGRFTDMVNYTSTGYSIGGTLNSFCHVPDLNRIVILLQRSGGQTSLLCVDDTAATTVHWKHDLESNPFGGANSQLAYNPFNGEVVCTFRDISSPTVDNFLISIDPSGTGSLSWSREMDLNEVMVDPPLTQQIVCDPGNGDIYYAVKDGSGDGLRVVRMDSLGVKQEEVEFLASDDHFYEGSIPFPPADLFYRSMRLDEVEGLHLCVKRNTPTGYGWVKMRDLAVGTYATDELEIVTSNTITISAGSLSLFTWNGVINIGTQGSQTVDSSRSNSGATPGITKHDRD